MATYPDIILVHGMWHQPAHFSPLAEELRHRGFVVVVPRLHRGSLLADIAAVQGVVNSRERPPVLVGHSYGGAVVTGLTGIAHAVFIAAFVPDKGESCASLGGEKAPVNSVIVKHADGTTSIPASAARRTLYGDCDEKTGEWASNLLVAQQPGHGRGVAHHVSWRSVGSTYVICEQDRALDPALQREMSRRCTTQFSLDCSHSPFISRVPELGRIVAGAAHELQHAHHPSSGPHVPMPGHCGDEQNSKG